LTEALEKQLKKMHDGIDDYPGYGASCASLTPFFYRDLNELQQIYGNFIGKAKATYPNENNYLTTLDTEIIDYLTTIANVYNVPKKAFSLLNLASGRISELIAYVNTLASRPPIETIPKSVYAKALNEKEELRKTIDIMVQYKGLPELNTLMESAKNHSLPLDEYWVLALCATNLIEAVVNKKLKQLGEKDDGNFEERYKRLCEVIKQKEGRDIHQILPSAIYKVRNKLDHCSDSTTVTPNEAKEISQLVMGFMNQVLK
jgi:hypothetical protein